MPRIDPFKLSNVPPTESNLPVMLRISLRQGRKGQFSWVLVSNHGVGNERHDHFCLSIADNPLVLHGVCKLPSGDLERVKKWVVLNRSLLEQHWHDELSSKAVLNSLVPLP